MFFFTEVTNENESTVTKTRRRVTTGRKTKSTKVTKIITGKCDTLYEHPEDNRVHIPV